MRKDTKEQPYAGFTENVKTEHMNLSFIKNAHSVTVRVGTQICRQRHRSVTNAASSNKQCAPVRLYDVFLFYLFS